MNEVVTQNVRRLKDKISEIAQKTGQSADAIELIAVSKTKPLSMIYAARSTGISFFGENRAQELISKHAEQTELIRWHFIGHLQTNKAARIVEIAELIQSVDSIHLARILNQLSEKRGIETKILLQVNTSQESSKFGFSVDEMESVCKAVNEFPFLRVQGLMTIGPFTEKVGPIIKSFASLRKLSERIKEMNLKNFDMRYLSMGMSNDYEIAIREGSNMLRIGSAIFGARN